MSSTYPTFKFRTKTGNLAPHPDCYGDPQATHWECLANVEDYGYAPLAAIPRALLKLDGADAVYATSNGETFFIGSIRVKTLAKFFELNIISMFPESDVIGDVRVGRTIAILVSVLIFVVGTAVGFLCVWILLRPLNGVADHIYRAAALEDDEDEHEPGAEDSSRSVESPSILSEIAALENAYQLMNAELNRLKKFVPQSVLATTKNRQKGIYSSEDEEGDVDAELEDFAGAYADRASQSTNTQSVVSTSGGGTGRKGKDAIVRVNPQQQQQQGTANHLNLSSQLSRKDITVLCMNLGNFHSLYAFPSSSRRSALLAAGEGWMSTHLAAFGRAIDALVELVLQCTRESRGVLDSFQGDRFVITFNAVQTVTLHQVRAAKCALRIVKRLQAEEARDPSCAMIPNIGIASGSATVGNCGSSQMKRFNAVGGVFTKAMTLERLCKMYPSATTSHCVSVLTHDSLFRDIDAHILYRCIDLVQLPFSKRASAVAAVVSEIGIDADQQQQQWPTSGSNDVSTSLTLSQQFASETKQSRDVVNSLFVDLAKGKVSEVAEKFPNSTASCSGSGFTYQQQRRRHSVIHKTTVDSSEGTKSDPSDDESVADSSIMVLRPHSVDPYAPSYPTSAASFLRYAIHADAQAHEDAVCAQRDSPASDGLGSDPITPAYVNQMKNFYTFAIAQPCSVQRNQKDANTATNMGTTATTSAALPAVTDNGPVHLFDV